MREFPDLRRVPEPQIQPLEPSLTFDEHLRRTVHEYIRNLGIVQQRLQNTEAEELGTQRLDLLIGHVARHRCSDPLTQRQTAGWIGVEREHRTWIKTRGDIGSDARQ